LGERQNVATMNCQSATVLIDYGYSINRRRKMITADWGLTAKSVLEYAQGGMEDTRIRITNGRPLAF